MVNTVQIKQQQLEKGFFTIGSGPKVILVMGSCRVCNFITYLHEWSAAHGNPFTIHSLDPFNWCWDEKDNRVDYIEAISKMEQHEGMLSMLRSVDIFIHEFYANYGMFNCDKGAEKNIYQFGLNASTDICLPNFNDVFLLAGDILTFDTDARKKAIQDFNSMGKLSDQTKQQILSISKKNLDKFYDVCYKSDVPEMATYFFKNFPIKRLFWSYNHTSKHFTIEVFERINEKFLKLDLSTGFDKDHEDIFANNYTKLTELDVEMYGYDWGEEIIPLKDKLF